MVSETLTHLHPPTVAEISLKALKENFRILRERIPASVKIMGVVKANGYGHGAADVGAALVSAGADFLAVASLFEAAELRDAGITALILILSESPAEAADEVIRLGVHQTVYTNELAQALSEAARRAGTQAPIHIKVDTGMGRVGIDWQSAAAWIQEIARIPALEIAGLFTHFAKAELKDDPYTQLQTTRFETVRNALKQKGISIPLTHAANSAAALFHPQTHYNMVRLGLCLYGLNITPQTPFGLPLQPVLSLKTRVLYAKRAAAGTSLGYGGTYITPRETTIVTLPIGYADGLHRAQSGIGQVLIHGRRFPIVGRISMDLTLVDAGEEDVKIGDEVVVIGIQGTEKIRAEDLAAAQGTIAYEIVCGIGKRVPRLVKEEK